MKDQFQHIEIMIEKINYLYSQMSKDGDVNNQIELSLLKKYSSELYDRVIDLELAVANKMNPDATEIEKQIAKAIEQEAAGENEESSEQLELKSNSVEDVVRLDFAAEGKRIMRRIKRVKKLNGDVIEVYHDDTIEDGTMDDYKKPLNKYLPGAAMFSNVTESEEKVVEELSAASPEAVLETPVLEETESVANEMQEIEQSEEIEVPAVEIKEVEELAELEEESVEEPVMESAAVEEVVPEEAAEPAETLEEPVMETEEQAVQEMTEEIVQEVPEKLEAEVEASKIDEIEIVEAISPAEDVSEMETADKTIEIVESLKAKNESVEEEIEKPMIAEASAPVEASSEIEALKDSDWVKAAEEEGKLGQEVDQVEAAAETIEEETIVEQSAQEEITNEAKEEKPSLLEEIFGKTIVGTAAVGGAASLLGSNDTEIIDQPNVAEEAVDEVEKVLESAMEAEVASSPELAEVNEEILNDVISDTSDETAVLEPEAIEELVVTDEPEGIAQSEEIVEPPTESVEALAEPEVLVETEESAEEALKEEPVEEIIQTPVAGNFFEINNNQKIRFTNELFAGEQATYDNTLNEMSQCKNVIEAYTYINLHIKAKYKWDSENETVREFQKIVKDKFLG